MFRVGGIDSETFFGRTVMPRTKLRSSRPRSERRRPRRRTQQQNRRASAHSTSKEVLPGHRDELMRSLHAVVLAEGNIPDPIVSCIASASLTALKNKDASHRLVAGGETLRRLTANAVLTAVFEDMTRHLRPSQLRSGTKAVRPSSTPSDDGSGNTTTTKNAASRPWIWRTSSTRLIGSVFFWKSDE